MSGLLAVFDSQKPTPWHTMFAEVEVLGGDNKGEWHNAQVKLSLGRAQSYNTPEACYETPVVSYEGCMLVWDGRLDDRESLLYGRPASRVTDAQLIIESYRHWGDSCLLRLIGEFVFILWDATNDRLFVGCDCLGGRTIAYYWDGQTLLLSSRAVTLLHHPQVSKQLNELYIAHTLCDFWAHPPGITPFADIQRLRPGYALSLKSGQLQQRQITQLSAPDYYVSARNPQVYYDKFWYLLDQSVKARLRTQHRICTTLSGGLDSTTVTVSLLNQLPKLDAISIVTEIFPEFDEQHPIQSFLQRYPQVRWHTVNCDRAWALSEPWEHLPVTDDPTIGATVPMNLQVMQQMQQLGFGTIFDGEGGDELFQDNLSLRDLGEAGNWYRLLQILRTQNRWHATLWREFILARLPKTWQSQWVAVRKSKLASVLPYIIPPWINSAYTQKPETQAALQQYFEMISLPSSTVQNISFGRESSGNVGLNQVYKLLASAHRIEYVSPLLDQRIVNFALHLPPILQNSLCHQKIFLRQVNQCKLPNDIVWRPKNNYFDPLKDRGLAKGNRAGELSQQIASCRYLQEIINTQQFTDFFKKYRSGSIKNNIFSNKIYVLLTLVNWYQRIEKHYF